MKHTVQFNQSRSNCRTRRWVSVFWLVLFVPALQVQTAIADDEFKKRKQLLDDAKTVLFLGDSITYAGDYVAFFEAWMHVNRSGDKAIDALPRIVNAGLPSETVSGLSEKGHAGGRFPRPDLAERLKRVLDASKPDLVFACYGINCGIYQKFDKERFEAFKTGIRNLKHQVEACGATLILITPPVFDDRRARKKFEYDKVMTDYSKWLVTQVEKDWLVIDLHSGMKTELMKRRKADSKFTFQPDAVHPSRAGHWCIAQQMILWFGGKKYAEAQSVEQMLQSAKTDPRIIKLFKDRLDIRRDALLSWARHKRPGIKKGEAMDVAENQAKIITSRIISIISGLDVGPNR